MPAHRNVPATRGAAWITEGLLGLRRAPGAFLGACLIVAVLRSLPLLGVFVGMLMPVFYGGLVSLLRTRAEGGNGRANRSRRRSRRWRRSWRCRCWRCCRWARSWAGC